MLSRQCLKLHSKATSGGFLLLKHLFPPKHGSPLLGSRENGTLDRKKFYSNYRIFDFRGIE